MSAASMLPGRTAAQSLLTVDELAALLSVSADWVRDHATRKQPRLPVIRVGKLLRFRPNEIERWIQEQTQRAC
jgi:excisionase family DNA binding protein